MNISAIKKFLIISAAMMISNHAYAETIGAWAGADFTNDSFYTFAGAVVGVSGQKNISKEDGVLVRADIGYGRYDYDTIFYQGGDPTLPYDVKINGDVGSVSAMVGYRDFYNKKFDDVSATFYLGAEVQDQELSPDDPGNRVEGRKAGVKAMFEISARETKDYRFDVAGYYSSAFDTFWSRASMQYTGEKFSIGPELIFMGNNGYEQKRAGIAGSYRLIEGVHAAVSVGGSENSRQGTSGAYTTISISKAF